MRISALASAHAEARALQTALKLNMFETLAAGALSADALARSIGTEPRATGLLANALAALGILDKSEERYGLSPDARRYLLESSGEYLGGMILFDEGLWDVWGRLEHSIRSGQPARTPDMFQRHPEETRRFIGAMDSLVRARGDAEWLAENLDLKGVGAMADLGGGPGTYLAAILRRHPSIRATVWDLPATLEAAREILAAREPDLVGRIGLMNVDYLTADLPGPVDAILMSNIIHSENEETNTLLMKKCFAALAPGGMLVVKDHVMNEALTEPAAGAVFALYLLLTTRGRDYSFGEISHWLRAAGFDEISERRLPDPPFTSSLVIARKP